MKRKFVFVASLILAAAVMITACIGVQKNAVNSSANSHSSPVINWGLTPNTKEKTPGAPANGAELLKEHDGMFVGPTDEKRVYLTFDLGYEAGYTAAVLDILKEHKIKGIFFLCGNYLQEDELICRMIDEGHTIGNHTNHHKDLPTLGNDKIKEDITSLSEKFKETYGNKYNRPLTHFRPPKGRFNEEVLKTAADEGLKAIMWSVAIVDWGKSPIDAQKNADKITSRIHPGAIILLHITNSGTPEMLKLLIPQLTEKGYAFGDSGAL